MTLDTLTRKAELLEKRISGANGATRLQLQPEFTRILDKLRAQGGDVPDRLKELDSVLVDEAIEARFDNMPL